MIRRCLPLVFTLALMAACSGSEPPPEAAPAVPSMIDSFAAGASARVTGRTPGASEPAPQVDLWDTAQRANLQCQLPHGTEVVVTASARLGDGAWMYEVDGKTCKGWAAATSLEAPTADVVK